MIMKAMVKKIQNIEKNKQTFSIFHLAKYNKYSDIFEDLAELSPYELLSSEVVNLN